MPLLKRVCALALLVALNGCGGGKGVSDKLFTIRSGTQWTYRITGSVTLPDAAGGGTQAFASDKSSFSIVVGATNTKDANNETVLVLDRKYDLSLLDGRRIQAIQRLYVTQSDLGLFVHGANSTVGTTVDPAADAFVPSTAKPPFKFLYIPDPAAGGTTLSYTDPLDTAGIGAYSLSINNSLVPVTVPAGEWQVHPATINETFDTLTFNNVGFVPNVGIVSANVAATLADTTKVNGTIALTGYTP